MKTTRFAVMSFMMGLLPIALWLLIQTAGFYKLLWIFPLPAPLAIGCAVTAFVQDLKVPAGWTARTFYILGFFLGLIGLMALALVLLEFDPNRIT